MKLTYNQGWIVACKLLLSQTTFNLHETINVGSVLDMLVIIISRFDQHRSKYIQKAVTMIMINNP